VDKGLILNNDKPTTNKEVMMGPDSVKMAIRHEIQDRWILYESKWIYEIDRLGWNILEESLTCRKIVYDKVQRVEYDKIRSSVAMLIVYVDYSSNHYIFLLWDMLVGWQNTLLNRSMYTRYNQEFCWSVEY
jgi:hypothetical protein